MINVLVTDAEYKHSYPIILSIQKNKINVAALFNQRNCANYYSFKIKHKYVAPVNILKNQDDKTFEKYYKYLISIITKNNIELLIPVSNISYYICNMYRNDLKNIVNFILPNSTSFSIAQNKRKTFEMAMKSGWPIPKTILPNTMEDIEHFKDEIQYPCVIKKVNYNESGVIYCKSESELLEFYRKVFNNTETTKVPIIQEYIHGQAFGFFALYREGICQQYFMHERIHEYPITGGASSLARSIYDSKLEEIGLSILNELNWNGVAMLEFKKDINDNKYKLIEINPKFWGSFELSIQSGLNMPLNLYYISKNKKVINKEYKKNVFFRWLFPFDVLWYLEANADQKKRFNELKKKEKIFNDIYLTEPFVMIFKILLTIYLILFKKTLK